MVKVNIPLANLAATRSVITIDDSEVSISEVCQCCCDDLVEGIEKASDKDVAGIIIQHLEKRVAEVAHRGSRSRTRGKG